MWSMVLILFIFWLISVALGFGGYTIHSILAIAACILIIEMFSRRRFR